MDSQITPRVLLLGSFPPQAQGIQEYCAALATALGQRMPVRAVGFRAMYPRRLFPGVKEAMDPTRMAPRAPQLAVEHRLAWYNPTGWVRLAATAPEDLLHAQWWSLPLFPVYQTCASIFRARKKPLVLTVHNVQAHERSGAYARATRRLCKQASRVIVHSEANRAQLIAQYGLPETRVVRIAMGETGTQPLRARKDAAEALSLPPDRRYVLFFGTVRPYKGVDILLEAFAAALPKLPDVDLLIAGMPWGGEEGRLRRLIAELGIADRVHARFGYVPEVETPDYFSVADLVALPYRGFEAQSAVASLALHYRVPLVLSTVGGLPEWVDHAPQWLVPPDSAPALSERLRWFFAAPEERKRTFAQVVQRVQAATAWERLVEEYLAVYREALSGAP